MAEIYDKPPNQYSNKYLIRIDRSVLRDFSKQNRPEQALAQALVYNSILIGLREKHNKCENKIEIEGNEYPEFYHSLTDFQKNFHYLISKPTIERAIKKLKDSGQIVSKTKRGQYTNTYFGIPTLSFCDFESLKIKKGLPIGYTAYKYYEKTNDEFMDFEDLVQTIYAPGKQLGLARAVIFENLNKMITKNEHLLSIHPEENKDEFLVQDKDDGWWYKIITIRGLLDQTKIFSSFGLNEDTISILLKIYENMGLIRLKKRNYGEWCIGAKLGETYIEEYE